MREPLGQQKALVAQDDGLRRILAISAISAISAMAAFGA